MYQTKFFQNAFDDSFSELDERLLTTRFFLFDAVSGVPVNDVSSSSGASARGGSGRGVPQAVRYLKRMELR